MYQIGRLVRVDKDIFDMRRNITISLIANGVPLAVSMVENLLYLQILESILAKEVIWLEAPVSKSQVEVLGWAPNAETKICCAISG